MAKKDDIRKKSVSDKPDRPGRNGGKLKSGNTVNMTGRPPILPDIKKAIAYVLGKEPIPGKTQLDILFDRIFQLAIDGDTKAAQILLDRGYGKELQRMTLESEAGKVTEINVRFQRENE